MTEHHRYLMKDALAGRCTQGSMLISNASNRRRWRQMHTGGHFAEVLLVNAQHIKAVPGRKTDQRDSEWIDLRSMEAGVVP